MQRPEMPEGAEFPDGMQRPEMPEGAEFPDGMQRPEMPEGGFGGMRGLQSSADAATSDFVLTKESTGFTNVRTAE